MSVAIENLHAIVFAIAHQDTVLAINKNRMGRHELTRAGADLAETRPPRAFGGERMDAGVAVSIGDINRAVGRHGGSGRMVEGLVPSRASPLADAQHGAAGEIEDDHLMGVAVDDPDAIPAVDRNSVRVEDFALAVVADEGPVRLVDDHGRLASPQDMNMLEGIDRDLADARWRETGRTAAEVAFDRIAPAGEHDGALLRSRRRRRGGRHCACSR